MHTSKLDKHTTVRNPFPRHRAHSDHLDSSFHWEILGFMYLEAGVIFLGHYLSFHPGRRSMKRSGLSVVASSFHRGSIGQSPRQPLMGNGSSEMQTHPCVSISVGTFIVLPSPSKLSIPTDSNRNSNPTPALKPGRQSSSFSTAECSQIFLSLALVFIIFQPK